MTGLLFSRRVIRWFAIASTALFLIPVATMGVLAAELDDKYLGEGPGRFNSIRAKDVDGDGNVEITAGNFDGYFFMIEGREGRYYDEWRSPDLGKRNWGLEFIDVFPDGGHGEEMVGGVGTGDGQVFIWDPVTKDVIWKTSGLISDPHGIAFGDVDNDGKGELFVSGGYKTANPNGKIYVYECDRVSSCALQDTIGNFDSRMRAIEIFDIDGDDQLEVIFGTGVAQGETVGEGYIYVYSWDGARFVREWKSPDMNGCVQGLALVDVDSDGKKDIIVSSGYRLLNDGFVWIIKHTGGAGISEYRIDWQSDNVGPKPYGFAVGDINGDGAFEAVVGNQPGYIWILDLAKREVEWKSGLLGTDAFGIDLADVDKDGDIEIVVGQGGYNGKGDWTSAYTDPHIYIIDGTTHQIEYVIGQKDYVDFGLTIVILVLIIITLFNVNRYFRTPKIVITPDGGQVKAVGSGLKGRVQHVDHRRGVRR